MDLRQLEILQAIAETGSFSACGRKLHVSQSAISRQVMLLEHELGEALFLRVGRRVRMTPVRSGKETQCAAPLVNSYEQDSLTGGFSESH